MKKYIVELTGEERKEFESIIKAPRMAAHKRQHAQMLLKADQGVHGPRWIDADIANAFDCTTKSVERLRRRLVEHGMAAVLSHGNDGRGRPKKIDGKAEAHLIAQAPQGYNRWTVRLLADKIVELGIVDSCSKSTVHKTLKKTNLSLT